MRALALVIGMAVSGCSAGDGLDPEARRCGELPDIPAYSQCIEIYNARVAREGVQRPVRNWNAPANTPSEDNAAILLLGATAFSNGYTQPRPALTCWNYGPMMQCQ